MRPEGLRLVACTVLRQDVSFFDTTTTSGELTQGINEDTVSISFRESILNLLHSHFFTLKFTEKVALNSLHTP